MLGVSLFFQYFPQAAYWPFKGLTLVMSPRDAAAALVQHPQIILWVEQLSERQISSEPNLGSLEDIPVSLEPT